MKRLRHIFEAAGFTLAVALLRRLSPETASNLGGFLGRTLGPRLPVNERARRNLRLAMPELSGARVCEIIRGMWDNLGRVLAEYPHLGAIADPKSGRIVLENMERVQDLRDRPAAAILCSAHMANWEVLPVVAATNGIDMTVIVREPNNPLVRDTLERMRGVAGGSRVPKGDAGAKQSLMALRDDRVLGLLFDQKLNRGLSIPFFGVEAMTAAAPAQLALRYRCPLIPVRVERLGPARFRLTGHDPLTHPKSGDKRRDMEIMMRELNEILEDWIRARPEQWLWLHRRWPKQVYAQAHRAEKAA